MSSSSLELIPATPSEAPALAKLEAEAFASDLAFRTMYGQGSPIHINFRSKNIEDIIANDKAAQLNKVVIDGELAGWGLWYFYTNDELLEKREKKLDQDREIPESANAEACEDFYAKLNAIRRRMSGIRHAHLALLVTLPPFQGRGVGSTILKYGLAIADKEGLPSLIEASPAGYSLYRKYGFEDFQTFVLDTTKYGGAGEAKTVGMIRPPSAKKNESIH